MIAPSSTDHSLYPTVLTAIKTVFDPEIPVDVYELGLIYTVTITDNNSVQVLMTLTSPSCPAAETIPVDIENAIKAVPEVEEVHVEITFDPPYDTDRMSEAAKLELGF